MASRALIGALRAPLWAMEGCLNASSVGLVPCAACSNAQHAARQGLIGASWSTRRMCSQPGKGKAAVPTESPDVEKAELMRKAAETATASMFPWERKQMDGSSKPLSRFDKFYWMAFGGAILFLVVVNGRRWWISKEKPKVDESKERLKEDMALEIASGNLNILQCQDAFEGSSPQDILTFVDEARQRARVARSKQVDEYDGLTPDEINALAASRAQL